MSAEQELRRYCLKKGLNPDGQFIETDGYLFTDGYELGHKHGSVSKKNRIQKLAELVETEAIKKMTPTEINEVICHFKSKVDALIGPATEILNAALDGVRVHPCDEKDVDIKLRQLPPCYKDLHEALTK